MGKILKSLPPQVQAWTEARQRHHLSHAQAQMARELGLNPRKLGKIANHRQEPWKAPLPQFIENLYLKRFGRERPQGRHVGREMGAADRGQGRRGAMLQLRTAAVSSEREGCHDRS
jgi:hypothetical protein